MSTIWAFDHIGNEHTIYRLKDCKKKFCESLREHVKNIIHFEKKRMLPLTKEKIKSHEEAKVCYICGKIILKKLSKNINYRENRDHCHYTGKYSGAAHSLCNLKFNAPNEIPVVFHNPSNYDYRFIIKELANKSEGQFEYFGGKTEMYRTFSVLI